MNVHLKLGWLFFSAAMAMTAQAAPTPLKIQDIITLVQSKGLHSKDIQLGYQKSEAGLLLSEANFDTQLYVKAQNEDSKAEAPGAFSNDRDQTNTLAFGLSRKFTTGSTLGLDYAYLHRDSELGAFMRSTNASPIQYYHLTTLSFKQDLLNNAFGIKDRNQSRAAQLQYQRALFERDEATEELILQTIKLYLDAYFAQENLKQSLAARDKYLVLFKNVQQKNRMGFDDRSELIKTKAELQNQERNVKSATLLHATLVQKLYSMLNTPPPAEVVIDIPDVLPSPEGGGSSFEPDGLRRSKSTNLLVQATEAERDAATNNQWSNLNFYTQAAFSGLDSANAPAQSEMTSRENPKYTVGLEFVMRWGSSAQKAEGIAKKVAHEEALNQQLKVRNDLQETLERTQRNLQAKYVIAVNAQEAVKIWEDAMKSQERNHRFGRITAAELMMDYGSYFRAKSALSGATADYQLALYEHQAARDELIKSQN
jgi:outer membrane protein TolC